MFGTSKTKTTVKNGFVVPKESNWARLTEAQLFIYPTVSTSLKPFPTNATR